MNTIYRIVWNAATGRWMVTSELAKGRTKRSVARSNALSLVIGGLLAATAPAGHAVELGTGVQVGNPRNTVIGDDAKGPTGACTTLYMIDPDGPEGPETAPAVCSTVIGNTASATAQASVVIGDHASATASHATVIGAGARAARFSQAIGAGADATGGTHATAIGQSAKATATDATAIGTNATAIARGAVAIGSGAHANADDSFAIGWNSRAEAVGSMAFGRQVSVQAEQGIAMGSGATVGTAAQYGVAIGRNASVTAGNSVSVGQGSLANRANTVSVGSAGAERQVVNVAAATADTDAVNLSQLKASAESTATALGGGAGVDASGRVTAPSYTVGGTTHNNVGSALGNLDGRTTTLQGDVNTLATDVQNQFSTVNTTIGELSDTLDNAVMYDGADKGAVSFGGASGTVLKNVAAGEVSEDSREAVNGSQLHATNQQVEQNTTAITNLDGRVTTVDNRVTNLAGDIADGNIGLVRQDADSRAITVAGDKDGTSVNFAGTAGDRVLTGVAAGVADSDAVNVSQLKATEQGIRDDIGLIGESLEGAVMYDGADKGAVSFGGASGTVLKNVAAGEVSEDSRDAVNGSQLHATNQQVEQNTTAITNLDGRVTTVDNRVTNLAGDIADGNIGLVRQDADSRAITVAGDKDGTSVNFAGTAGDRVLTGVAAGVADSDAVNVSQLKATEQGIRDDIGLIGESLEGAVMYDGADKGAVSFGGASGTVLKNVAAGEVSEDSRDAVNGSQLHATNQQVEQNTTAITNLDGRVTTIEGNLDNGSIGLVRQDASSREITVAAATDGTRINLAGTAGDRVLTGVAAGVADNDAVNVSQLKAAGLIGEDGSALNAVVYDSDARDSITLGGKGAAQAVKIKNVADATEDDEAVNLRQLKDAGLVGEGGQTLDAVTYDAGSNRGQVTFAGANGTVLANVADGRIVAGSRDAVNGGQIAALRDQLQGQISDIDSRVTNIEQNGGAGGKDPYFDANGQPVQGAPGDGDRDGLPGLPQADAQASGASAVAAGNGAAASGSASVAIGAGSQATADNAVALGSGSVADREGTVSVGSQGHERQITNVKAGVRDTDAVNVSQLNQRLAEANAYTDQRIDDMWQGVNDRIDHASRQANRGIAGASAMIPVTPYMPGKTVLNAGMATYRGETALGVGVSRWNDNGRVNYNAGVSVAKGDSPIFRVGVGVVLGD